MKRRQSRQILLQVRSILLSTFQITCLQLSSKNPELYLEQLHAKYREPYEKVVQQKRLKKNGGHSNGSNLSGGVAHGERLNAAQRERMRLLTIAAFDQGEGEDTFGAKDEDWQLYILMSKDNDYDDGADWFIWDSPHVRRIIHYFIDLCFCRR